MNGHQIKSAEAARDYAFAGKAIITLVSEATGTRYTYKITASDSGRVHFVSYLRGPDNGNDYCYIGFIRQSGSDSGRFIHGGVKAKADRDSLVCRAIRWTISHLTRPTPELPDKLQVWHEGRCGKCGKRLTVPESIETGLGPYCARAAGVRPAKRSSVRSAKPALVVKEHTPDDQEMARMEAEADREQTQREEQAKFEFKQAVESVPEPPEAASGSLDELRRRFSA